MREKLEWKVNIGLTNNATMEVEGIKSTSKKGARRQVRKRLKKAGIEYDWIDVDNTIEQKERIMKEKILETSEDYGTFIQTLTKMSFMDTKDIQDGCRLLSKRLKSLSEQCQEMRRSMYREYCIFRGWEDKDE